MARVGWGGTQRSKVRQGGVALVTNSELDVHSWTTTHIRLRTGCAMHSTHNMSML